MYNKEEITQWFMSLQDDICDELETADGSAKFLEDPWEREEGGGGRTRILTQGNVIEKGGVAFSAVYGKTPEKIQRALQLSPSDFYATGVSIVIHPQSPMVPIIHMNVRYFEMDNGIKWFGGGIDLTPHYINLSDAQYFHQALKEVCDRHRPEYYDRFKNWADDYFYIKHRDESRGIGGIFFDRLSPTEETSLDTIFHFVQDVGRAFAPIYTHLMQKNSNLAYGEQEKNWQLVRRGRYVEFNLVLDKGTKFGLDTQGRIESILMSLPPQANWQYNYIPPIDSPEYQTLQYLKKGINWVKA
ncbi:oxygen-dependent coproporphyrinogen oxidase [Catalinimonas niigatensis]|uniref:oxygen-dependent coproporphyrinogen oxidase n=1 Tax=Catalinimonas niigatensis TaxID=1397264 RepID=UPI0026657E3A|nr:oxygen-dependent coproporphyrinogen oxidase [Catalinimonas niigatensis]WPP53078.1 oxygen-dependent coproporphyrinogen oxidase [Catalinimonas niigatensis]